MSDIVEQNSSVNSVANLIKEDAWDDELNLSEAIQKQIYIKHFDGPIFFGFASKFQEMARSLPEVTVVIMRMELVPYIDQSGIYAIEDAVMALKERGVIVLIVGIQDQPKGMLQNIGLISGLIPDEHVCLTFSTCISALEAGTVKPDSENLKNITWNLN